MGYRLSHNTKACQCSFSNESVIKQYIALPTNKTIDNEINFYYTKNHYQQNDLLFRTHFAPEFLFQNTAMLF